MAEIPIGTRGETQIEVAGDLATSFLGLEDARVLATPRMIGLMEKTCRDAVLPLLDSGYDTVGTHVNVAHLAAAPLGSRVTFRAEVIGVDGRRIEFRVEAATEREKISEGTHQRAIINVAKFAAKQAEKRR
ncbi:MAG TPA: thioesterase family protein [Bryobacteraceae bacterium]|jgi:predicted thioesterase|nr:thioesterase family protein [Bryobacteraceae bacterium]